MFILLSLFSLNVVSLLKCFFLYSLDIEAVNFRIGETLSPIPLFLSINDTSPERMALLPGRAEGSSEPAPVLPPALCRLTLLPEAVLIIPLI